MDWNQPEETNLKRASLREEVMTHVRDGIFSGHYKPGEKIDQDQIAKTLGLSRLPVREALIALEGASLVEIIPRHGAFVARLSQEDIVDHYRIYAVVSGMAAERAAQNMASELFAEVRVNIAAMQNPSPTADVGQLNYEFHRLVNRAGASGRLLALVRGLSGGTFGEFFSRDHPWTKISASQHAEIQDAIEVRDSDGAREAMEKHIIDGGAHAVELLESRGLWGPST